MAERGIVLEFAATDPEREVLDRWLQHSHSNGDDVRVVVGGDPGLAQTLREHQADALVTPVRVAWLPRERGGTRAARISDLLAFRNPRRPSRAAQRRIVHSEPDRCRVVVGEPATVSELRSRFGKGGDGDLAAFVTRQGMLALDRAERSLIGTQYKVPRFVSEEIGSSSHFRAAVARLADGLNRPEAEVGAEAIACIDEMVASQSRFAIDVWGQFGNWLARAYTLAVERRGLDELRQLGRSHPLVFLPSHRSYVDPLVLRAALHDQGFPPSHVLGGINVGFWPIGPVARRSGYVFIRRSFKDDPVYKLALREYIAFLLRKRFSLEWYIEGGRSRTGKLRPPRYGLLAYLVEAFREGGVDDAYLVPVSIVYDQLHEVGAMAAEDRGAVKQAEGLAWLVGYARAQGQRLGQAHVQFGEPLSLRQALSEESAPGSRRATEVEKVAFEVCYRIGRATPITRTSLVTLALLGVEDRALTLAEVSALLEPLLKYVELRGLPVTGELDLRSAATLRRTLDALASGGVVSCFDGGLEPVFGIGSDRHLEAAFYRNGVIHFFVNRAITELVLARAAEEHSGRAVDEAWAEALRLRDLLKFEFFFARKRTFAEQVREELALLDPGWEQRPSEPEIATTVLAGLPLHLAHRVLRPFFEAYQVVADRLAARDPHEPIDEKRFISECIGVGRQYRLQQRLHSPESISKELFSTALQLAANRDLVGAEAGLATGGGEELLARRRAFAEEIAGKVRRIALVRDLSLRGLDLNGGPP